MSLDLFQNMQEIVDSLTDDLKEFDVKESILDTKHLNSISTFEEKPIKRLGDLHKIWNVLDEFKEDIYICGGYARWMCSPIIIPVIPNDIDIYCKTMDIYNRVKTKLKDFVVAKHVNDVSTTYFRPNNSSSPLFGLKELQLITPMKKGAVVTEGSLQEILQNFDFTIARIGIDYTLWTKSKALADSDFHKDENYHRLVFKNIHCPVSSLFRCIKYCNRGYKIKTAEIIKLFLDWENRTPEYKKEIVEFFGNFEAGKNMSQAAVSAMYNMLKID